MNKPLAHGHGSARHFVARMLEQGTEGRLNRFVDLSLMTMILVSVSAIVLESVDTIRAQYDSLFTHFEIVIVALFSLEIALRLWSAPDHTKYAQDGRGWRARLRYLMSPMAVIDVAAVLPFYLALFGMTGDGNLLVLRSVRLLRVLKLTRYSESFTVLTSVIHENVRGLAAAFFLLNVIMLLAACGIYVFENEAQPVAFGSIPAAMWWSFATLTTVGYGDVVPITAAGRVFGASITVVGVGMVALPTAILASAFSERLRVRAQRYREELALAYEDGVLTPVEAQELERLQHKLELSDDQVQDISEHASLTPPSVSLVRGEHASLCPHCQQALPVDQSLTKACSG